MQSNKPQGEALRETLAVGLGFGAWLYALRRKLSDPRGPILLKLHGSSNWEFLDNGNFKPRTQSWADFDETPGYRLAGEGTNFSIFLPFLN